MMARFYKCDRCKTMIEYPPQVFNLYHITMKDMVTGTVERTIDLCGDCRQQLDYWLTNPPNQEQIAKGLRYPNTDWDLNKGE